MSASNETTDSRDQRPLAKVIQLPKPLRGQSLRDAYENQRELDERMASIRDKIRNINQMIHDAHFHERKEK